MSIIKSITLNNGLITTYHKVVAILITASNSGSEVLIASINSWLDKDRYDSQETPYISSSKLNIVPQVNMFTTVENTLVADPTSILYGGIINQDVVLSDLDTAKAKKLLEIESAKNVEINTPKITSLGTFDNTDADNNKLSLIIQVTQLAQARGAPAVAGFKDSAGNWVEYTLDQLETVALEMAAQVIPLYTKEAGLVAQVDMATTIDEINAVVW